MSPYGPKSEGVLGGGGRLIRVGAVMVELHAQSISERRARWGQIDGNAGTKDRIVEVAADGSF